MIVRYNIDDLVVKLNSRLSENEKRYFDRWNIIPIKLPLTFGMKYVVLGLDYSEDGCLNYMLSDDTGSSYPKFYPSEFFKISDNRLSKYWGLNKKTFPIEDIEYPVFISFAEASNYYYFDMLVNHGDHDAIDIYLKNKKLIENEYPDDEIEIAEKIGNNWVMCSYCDESWKEDSQNGIIICPKNKHRNNNPLWKGEMNNLDSH